MCVVLASACASQPAALAPMVAPERGVIGGYHLGGARTTALAACPRPMIMLPHADRLAPLDLDYAGSCPGAPAPMALRVERSNPLFCGDELCAVWFTVDAGDPVVTSAEIITVLHERYGVARGEPVPDDCKADAATFAACVRSGRAELVRVWSTADAIVIVLFVDAKDRFPITLLYATERGAAHMNLGALLSARQRTDHARGSQ